MQAPDEQYSKIISSTRICLSNMILGRVLDNELTIVDS